MAQSPRWANGKWRCSRLPRLQPMGSGNCAQCGRPGWRRQVGQALVEVLGEAGGRGEPGGGAVPAAGTPRLGVIVIPKGGAQVGRQRRREGARRVWLVRKGLRSPSRDDWLGMVTPSRTR